MNAVVRFIRGLCSTGETKEFDVIIKQEVIYTDDPEKTINILVPKYYFPYFHAYRPESDVLSIQEYMHLYQYTVPNSMPCPGPEYQYQRYMLQDGSTEFVVQGWVPKLDIKMEKFDLHKYTHKAGSQTNKCWVQAGVKEVGFNDLNQPKSEIVSFTDLPPKPKRCSKFLSKAGSRREAYLC